MQVNINEEESNIVECHNFTWCKMKQPEWILQDNLCINYDIEKMSTLSVCFECKKINDINIDCYKPS